MIYKTVETTSNIDNYNYSDFSDFESSGSEYIPSTSVASDTSEENLNISSSILEKVKENLEENYQIGETKKKYSRKNKMLTETEKSVPLPIYDTNQPTTSKVTLISPLL